MTFRSMPMIWADGSKLDGKTNPCPCCGKEMKGSTFFVYMIGGGASVMHPDEVKDNQQHDSEAWWQPVGTECRKKFGEFSVSEAKLITMQGVEA